MAKLISRTITFDSAEGKLVLNVPSARRALQYQSAYDVIVNDTDNINAESEKYEIALPVFLELIVSLDEKTYTAEELEEGLSVTTVVTAVFMACVTRLSGNQLGLSEEKKASGKSRKA